MLLLLLLLSIRPSLSLLGYDCGGPSPNTTTISLLDIGECRPVERKPNVTTTYIQLLQTTEYSSVRATACRIEIERHITHCGMHSHASVVQGGYRKYLIEIDESTCYRMYNTRSYIYGNVSPITGLLLNSTNYRTLTLAGATTVDGTCHGSQFSDPYGTWNDVVVEASIHITLRDYTASAKPKQDSIILKSGVHCKLSELTCIDEDGSSVFWSPLPADSCNFHSYDVLYEGIATKMFDSEARYPVIYSLVSEDTTFALSKKSEKLLCGYTLIQTEHPKLIIVETTKGNSFAKPSRALTENLDAFIYINSKFVYMEKHLKTQIRDLYQNVIMQKCKLEQQILKNALSLANIRPDLFAYLIMKGPGYVAITAGEVAHLTRCVPIEVTRRNTDICYLEMPVTVNNNSMFLLPKTRVLTNTGTPVDCNPAMPTMFNLKGNWISLTPHPAAVLPPQTLEPLTRPTWKYTDAEHLATSGIYSSTDLDRLREHIMFPVERTALINNFAKAAVGHHVPNQRFSIHNLLDDTSLEKISKSAADYLWGGFLQFGTATAGLIGIWLIIKIIKAVADTIIHGYTLHTVYGWSIHLLGAVFSSITHLLLHLGRRSRSHRRGAYRPALTINQSTNSRNISRDVSPRSSNDQRDNTAAIPLPPPRQREETIVNIPLQTSRTYPNLTEELSNLRASLTDLHTRIDRCHVPQLPQP